MQKMTFNIYRSMKFLDKTTTCHQMDTIKDCVVKAQLSTNPEAPLERCWTSPRKDNFELTNEEIMHYIYALKALQTETSLLYVREELVQVEDMVKKPPKLELKTRCFKELRQIF